MGGETEAHSERRSLWEERQRHTDRRDNYGDRGTQREEIIMGGET